MTNAEIFTQATQAADEATALKFGNHKCPTPGNGAGEYWQLVFEATAAFLRKHVNGVY